jgi:hypothetical protein
MVGAMGSGSTGATTAASVVVVEDVVVVVLAAAGRAAMSSDKTPVPVAVALGILWLAVKPPVYSAGWNPLVSIFP